jgi:hypothetical protein
MMGMGKAAGRGERGDLWVMEWEMVMAAVFWLWAKEFIRGS